MSTLTNVISSLSNPDVNIVGIYGMGGIGRTMLAKEVAKQLEANKLFDSLIFVEVKQNPDRKKILNSFTFFLPLLFPSSQMGSKPVTMLALSYILVSMLLGLASSSIDQDKAECANQVVALATCLPYVGGEAKTPTIDCCTGLKQILDKSKKCLCILIKDRDDPSLGLKINGTLAASLPSACHSTANVTECITLLHLSPSSPDAKVFEGFANLTQGHSTTPAASVKGNPANGSTSASEKSDAGKGRKWLGLEMICGVLACFFFTLNLVSGM